MKCPDCGRRMRSGGSHERKGGEVVRNRGCVCGLRAVTAERILCVQRNLRSCMKAKVCGQSEGG